MVALPLQFWSSRAVVRNDLERRPPEADRGLPLPRPVRTIDPVDAATFHHEIRPAGQPVLIKGLVAGWPVVGAAKAGRGALLSYLGALASEQPVTYSIGAPEIEGRFHYREGARELNFTREQASLPQFLHLLDREAALEQPRALAGQGLAPHRCLPGFHPANPLPLLPPAILPRMWLGNAARVATHNDELENIACCAAGRRRFTLFPPEAVGDLYMGPFELTPGGTPISMVHVTAPDLDRYPRYADALEVAQVAEMEPGDALYVPYQWYHHVESLEPVNLLINYWWDPARQDLGSPWDALLHGMIALRGLPPDQRRAWKAAFDHYVFLTNGDPGAHLPAAARGVLGNDSPEYIARLKADLRANLDPASQGKLGPLG